MNNTYEYIIKQVRTVSVYVEASSPDDADYILEQRPHQANVISSEVISQDIQRKRVTGQSVQCCQNGQEQATQ